MNPDVIDVQIIMRRRNTLYHKMSFELKDVYKRLKEITRIRNSMGNLDMDSEYAREREDIIHLFVRCIQEEIPNIRNGIVKSKVAWRSPVLSSLRSQNNLTGEAAQRIAWELFPKQFSKETRDYVLGIENDPFYDNHEQYLLSDTLRVAIEVQKSSAEKRYRSLIRNMRACYLIKDPQESLVKEQSQQ